MAELFQSGKFTYLDGATGTVLQQNGLGPGENPALLNLTRPDLVLDVHRRYIEAGSDILCANTFGAGGKKLAGSGRSPGEVIAAGIALAREAARGRDLVALDIGPAGEMLAPAGTLSFGEAYELFREQAVAAQAAGADLVFLETMSDLAEVRAALLAVREHTELPVIACMTFEANGRSFTGCLPESFAVVCEGLGAAAVGVNCSLGPEEALPLAGRMAALTSLPVILKPNAGLPDPMTGAFPLGPEDFARRMAACAGLGIGVVGGCCGTSPEHIRALRRVLEQGPPPAHREVRRGAAVCSATRWLPIDSARVVGERINPTGKKRFSQALAEGETDVVLAQAVAQADAGAQILDVNVGVPGIDEAAAMDRVVREIQAVCDLPLQIDSSDPAALEAGLRAFCGKAIVNSVNGEQAVLDRVLPLVKRYGAAVIGLTLDGRGVPESAGERVDIARRILAAALRHGIAREDVFIDCLALTVSAQPQGAAQTLAALHRVKDELGLRTALGVSNISFGLPARGLLNRTFLTMALEEGLDLPILNPNASDMMDAVYAFRLLRGEDPGSAGFLDRFAARQADAPQPVAEDLRYAILRGLGEEARRLASDMLRRHGEMELVDGWLIPALDEVGRRFESGELFLPQLLNASAAAGEAFEVVRASLAARGERQPDKGTIVMATVRGDIHDIGKNIVRAVLENYGYRIVDLGKDVPEQAVVDAVRREGARLAGLSALMTTTLGSMERTVAALRAADCGCRVFVGGAVVTAGYAARIGADFYARDARESVEIARKVLG